MSLILNALDKADHEDAPAELVPGLRSQLRRFTSGQTQLFFGLPPYALAIILVLSVVVVALASSLVLQSLNSDQAGPAMAPTQVTSLAEQVTSLAEGVPSVEQDKPAATVGSIGSASSDTASDMQSDTSSDMAPAELHAAEVRAPVKPDLSPEIAALYQNRSASAASSASPSAARKEIVIKPSLTAAYAPSTAEVALAQQLWDASKPKPLPDDLKPYSRESRASGGAQPKSQPAQAANKTGPSIEALTEVKFLHQLPVSVQNRIPSINYAQHEYLGGYVVLNKQTVTVGSTVVGDVVLEGLYADGIVLRMQDRQFKLSALSSWINF